MFSFMWFCTYTQTRATFFIIVIAFLVTGGYIVELSNKIKNWRENLFLARKIHIAEKQKESYIYERRWFERWAWNRSNIRLILKGVANIFHTDKYERRRPTLQILKKSLKLWLFFCFLFLYSLNFSFFCIITFERQNKKKK